MRAGLLRALLIARPFFLIIFSRPPVSRVRGHERRGTAGALSVRASFNEDDDGVCFAVRRELGLVARGLLNWGNEGILTVV